MAERLKEWLRTVLPYADPWLSSEDIRKGKRWDDELTAQLEATSYSLVCVTERKVAAQAWVNFEAGAVSKYVADAYVSPILVDASPEEIEGLPLSRYQCTAFTEEDMARLLRTINRAADSQMSVDDLDRNLRNTWSQLAQDIGRLTAAQEHPLPTSDDRLQGEDEREVSVDVVPAYLVGRALESYEITGLRIATGGIDGMIEIYDFYQAMNQEGCDNEEATLSQSTLIDRGFLRLCEIETQHREPYTALRVTRAGRKWLLEYRDQKTDDLPF